MNALLDNHEGLDNEKAVMDWLEMIEKSCGVSPTIGNRFECEETGDPYVEVLWDQSGGTASVDDFDVGVRVKTPEVAWKMWALAFWLYFAPRGGKIHWRVRPDMGCIDDPEVYKPEEMGYHVYARLFVESKP